MKTSSIKSRTRKEQEKANLPQRQSNMKNVIKIIGVVLSFYVTAVVMSAMISEDNLKAQLIIMTLPATAVIIYGYWAVTKSNYLILRIVFMLLLFLVALEWAYRIISRL